MADPALDVSDWASAVGKLSREVRRQQRKTKQLTDCVMLMLADLDALLEARRDLPDQVGRDIARWANALDMANDSVRYSNGVDFRKDDKARAVKKLRERHAR